MSRVKSSKAPKNITQNGIGLVHRRNYQLDHEAKEITIWEESNPNCLVNMLPKVVGDAVRNLSPEICSMSESEHLERFKISDVDEMLRLAFWDEYFQTTDDRISHNGEHKMRMDAIYPRICSRETFYNAVVGTPHRLAYIIKPPRGYMLQNRTLLEKGYKRLEEVLKLPLIDSETGKPFAALIGQFIKITVLLENRVRGSVAHQVHISQQNLNVNVDYEAPKGPRDIDYEIEMADKEIAALNDTGMISDRQIMRDVYDATRVIDDK
jgi:hypothetical protein